MFKDKYTKQEMIERIVEEVSEIEEIYEETTKSYERVYIEAELDMYEYFLVLIEMMEVK